jgi:nitroimidazol reductase NimA-like FMN-containing flavoprotein (pyridoxamine 5'-phosphate oxidase superfamily)
MKIIKDIPFERSSGTVSVAQRLEEINSTELHAVLATDSNGQPYTSLIAYAMTPDMRKVIFATPKDTAKYKNILRNNKVALLIDTRSNTNISYMNSEAITIIGTARPVRRGRKWDALAHILLKKHSALKSFVEAKTTAIILVEAVQCFHTSSFQKVSEWRLR